MNKIYKIKKLEKEAKIPKNAMVAQLPKGIEYLITSDLFQVENLFEFESIKNIAMMNTVIFDEKFLEIKDFEEIGLLERKFDFYTVEELKEIDDKQKNNFEDIAKKLLEKNYENVKDMVSKFLNKEKRAQFLEDSKLKIENIMKELLEKEKKALENFDEKANFANNQPPKIKNFKLGGK